MKQTRSRIAALMMILLSVLAIYASFSGIMDPSIYEDVLKAGTINHFLWVGSIAQDIIAIPMGLCLAVLALVFLIKPGEKKFICMLGITGFFFYGYGLYAIQGQYSSLYLCYLAILGLSLYSMILGLLSFETNSAHQLKLPVALQRIIAVFLLIIPIVLIPRWVTLALGDMTRHIPGDTYAVFILDLCIVFPALIIISILLFKNLPFGNVLAGVALIKALTVCLSVGFGEWFQGYWDKRSPDMGAMGLFSILSVISLILLARYLKNLKKERFSNE